ncbi:MAG TPA: cupredoxin family copper-binding protein [Thermoanaerobaculaceae bacterium]|nr:cupredoxin family copper-binding protein [Thermoanaerobaculaceae bacterium]
MRTNRTIRLAVALALAGLAATAGRASDTPRAPVAPAARVTIDNFTFNPATITVPAGTTVTWTNRDDMPHTVVANDRSFRSGALDTEQTFSHTFEAPGTFVYFCSIHASMVGKVIVTKR